VVQELASPAEGLKRRSGYADYQKTEGIPIYGGFAIDDVRSLELGQWARTGGQGAFINLEGTGGANAAYVCEIPAGKSLHPQRHLFEELIYVVDGVGSTSVWYTENEQVSFEWKRGSLFSIPLNAWHRHHNLRGNQPARYLSVTTAPIVMNLFHNLEFVFNCPFAFTDRFDGRADYFSTEGREHVNPRGGQHVFETNFVSDTHAVPLYARQARGAGGRMAFFELADNTLTTHISQFPVGTYKKAHRHGPGAHVLVLDGQGFSLLWREGSEPRRVDWHAGSMLVPPDRWFHQHFNTGAEPARYLALRWGSKKHDAGQLLNSSEAQEGQRSDAPSAVDVRLGGDQIEYDGEDPSFHQRFEAALAANGVACQMRAQVPGCTGQPQ
jgi:quercetin dioxygenase-like cupin family protein